MSRSRTLALNISVLFTADSDYAADEVLYHVVQNKVYLSEWLTSTFKHPDLGYLHTNRNSCLNVSVPILLLVLGSAIETSHWNAGLVDSSGAVIGCWGQTKGSPESPYLTFTTLRRREATIGCVSCKYSDYYNSRLVIVLSFTDKKSRDK